jgi:hypothetical protein
MSGSKYGLPHQRAALVRNDRMLPKDPRKLPTEGTEQATLFSWAAMQSGRHPELRLLFHIPNGGSRGKAEAGRFKAEGVKPGVPDLFLPTARYPWNGLFIELKRQKGGRVSAAQRRWLDALEGEGYRVAVACGWKEAAEIILEYLEGRA